MAQVLFTGAAGFIGSAVVRALLARGDNVIGIEIDRIVHLGAQPGVRYTLENPHAYMQANQVGHLNSLELARQCEASHLAYASSFSVYGGKMRRDFTYIDDIVAGIIEGTCDHKAEIEMLPMQPGDVEQTYADIDTISNDSGYQPSSPVEVGFPAFVEWYRSYHEA